MAKELFMWTFVVSIALLGCSERKDDSQQPGNDKKLEVDLKSVGQERVFFGHQSVGGNIMQGVRDIAGGDPASQLKLLNLKDGLPHTQTCFADAYVGKNGNPKSKIDDFGSIMEKLRDANPSIALMKLCYVDITRQSDLDQIFGEYVSAIETLKQKHPSTIFVHVTAPLTAEEGLVRRIYHSLRGGIIDQTADNLARERYNEKLRKRFGSESIFDLAAVESTHPDGSREGGETPSGKYYSLVKAYASDEGHLNEHGRRIAARELVRVLAQVARSRMKQ
jgi:hypothetical protein